MVDDERLCRDSCGKVDELWPRPEVSTVLLILLTFLLLVRIHW
jgi:hypothetical protein